MSGNAGRQMSETELQATWMAYWTDHDAEARQRLILQYLPLVKYVVGGIVPALPKHLITDEILSAGVVGLMDAIEKFDPCSGAKFETYARQRIWGAVQDELRKCDWAPRSLRRKARTVAEAYASLEQELGRSATSREVGEYLSMNPGEVDALMASANRAFVFSLNALQSPGEGGEGAEMLHSISDHRLPPPDQRMHDEEVKRVLEEGLASLKEQERMVLVLYYYEELMLKEIGEILGVSESRVSQIHKESIGRLKARLSASLAPT